MRKRNFLLLLLAFISFGALAQETDGQFNPNSLLRIPKYEQLYKARVWRSIDLREKQNKGFFAKGNELSGLIVNAVKSGEIADVYEKDSLTTKMLKDVFMAGLVSQQGQTFANWDPALDNYSGDNVTYNGKNYTLSTVAANRGTGTIKITEYVNSSGLLNPGKVLGEFSGTIKTSDGKETLTITNGKFTSIKFL